MSDTVTPTPRGYAKNERAATEINLTDLLGIQQGTELADMKKVTWETLLEASKDYYAYEQTTDSVTWTIDHNLGKYPTVAIIDDSGESVIGEIQYVSINQIVLTFSEAISGKAFLN